MKADSQYWRSESYTFDAWGRTDTVTKNGVTDTYSWTSANLLAGIDSSDPNETDVGYVYTGDLKRIWRLENGQAQQTYQWDAGFNVLNEASVGQPMKTFVPGLAEVMGNDLGTAADYRYLTQDHLGSTRGMWDASATRTGSWEFTPYGSPYLFAGPPDVTQLYTGHDLDPVTGQYYAPFRYLDTGIGRWAKADPLGMIDGTNMYGYVGARPLSVVDALGLSGFVSPGFGSIDEAACAALQSIFSNSTSEDLEYGGLIYRAFGKYYYTEPSAGEQHRMPGMYPDNLLPQGLRQSFIGGYHTHGAFNKDYDGENFSRDDMEWSRYFGAPLYLMTPSGEGKKWKSGVPEPDTAMPDCSC